MRIKISQLRRIIREVIEDNHEDDREDDFPPQMKADFGFFVSGQGSSVSHDVLDYDFSPTQGGFAAREKNGVGVFNWNEVDGWTSFDDDRD